MSQVGTLVQVCMLKVPLGGLPDGLRDIAWGLEHQMRMVVERCHQGHVHLPCTHSTSEGQKTCECVRWQEATLRVAVRQAYHHDAASIRCTHQGAFRLALHEHEVYEVPSSVVARPSERTNLFKRYCRAQSENYTGSSCMEPVQRSECRHSKERVHTARSARRRT